MTMSAVAAQLGWHGYAPDGPAVAVATGIVSRKPDGEFAEQQAALDTAERAIVSAAALLQSPGTVMAFDRTMHAAVVGRCDAYMGSAHPVFACGAPRRDTRADGSVVFVFPDGRASTAMLVASA